MKFSKSSNESIRRLFDYVGFESSNIEWELIGMTFSKVKFKETSYIRNELFLFADIFTFPIFFHSAAHKVGESCDFEGPRIFSLFSILAP